MALIQCGECGKEVSDKAAACPGCGAPINAPAPRTDGVQKVVAVDPHVHAGKEMGEGCATALTSEKLSYVWFVLIWLITSLVLGTKAGLVGEGIDSPLWFPFVAFVLPIILAVVFRKVIRKVVPLVLGSALFVAVVGFFLLLLYIGFSMIFNAVK